MRNSEKSARYSIHDTKMTTQLPLQKADILKREDRMKQTFSKERTGILKRASRHCEKVGMLHFHVLSGDYTTHDSFI